MVLIHLSMGVWRVVKAKLWVVKEFECGQGETVVKASLRVVKEFEGGEGKIEDGEGIRGWWWNLMVKFELKSQGGEGVIEGGEGI